MGTLWSKSGFIERDLNDEKADGARAYFYVGGTTTPMTVFQDSSEATPHTIPVMADGSGRWPAVFIPFTVAYDVKVTDGQGSQLYYHRNIANPNPVDVTTVTPAEERIQTGMMIFEFTSNTKSGYVRANGRSIGNVASNATERANADTSNLFTYVWNNIAAGVAPVFDSTGATVTRGPSAASDFSANRAIKLPDMRGAIAMGMDGMGNTNANAFTNVPVTEGSVTTPGSLVGVNSYSLTVAQLPIHTPTGTVTGTCPHTPSGTVAGTVTHTNTTFNVPINDPTHNHVVNDPTHTHTPSYTNIQGAIGPGGSFAGGGGSGVSQLNLTIGASGTGISLNGAATGITASFNPASLNALTAWSGSFTGTAISPAISATFAGASIGSGSAHSVTSLARLGTWFMKL